MNIQAHVGENGILKITDPKCQGKEIVLQTSDWMETKIKEKTNWDVFFELASKADELDFPRRTHKEIIRDLHELRG